MSLFDMLLMNLLYLLVVFSLGLTLYTIGEQKCIDLLRNIGHLVMGLGPIGLIEYWTIIAPNFT